jgi:hypothetical protein
MANHSGLRQQPAFSGPAAPRSTPEAAGEGEESDDSCPALVPPPGGISSGGVAL